MGAAEVAMKQATGQARGQRRARKKGLGQGRLPGLTPSAVGIMLAQAAGAPGTDTGFGTGFGTGSGGDDGGLSPLLRDAVYLRRQQAAAEASRARKLAYAVGEGVCFAISLPGLAIMNANLNGFCSLHKGS